MNLKLILLTITMQSLMSGQSFGQRTDSTQAIGSIPSDSLYIIHENIPKSYIWGNSWSASTSYNLCKINEFDVNIGRTYGSSMCGGGGCVFSMRSWGAGYGLSIKNGQPLQMVKAFWESCFFYFPPFSAGVRADYIYDITNKTHYLRPSAGLSLFYIDLFYNYTFNVNGTDNLFKHGLTLRLKYFHKQKNWQKNYPNRC